MLNENKLYKDIVLKFWKFYQNVQAIIINIFNINVKIPISIKKKNLLKDFYVSVGATQFQTIFVKKAVSLLHILEFYKHFTLLLDAGNVCCICQQNLTFLVNNNIKTWL